MKSLDSRPDGPYLRGMRFDRERLKQAREAAVRTQQEIADACGVTARTVQNWENGNGEPDAGDLGKIAAECGKPVKFFYIEDEPVARRSR